MIHLISRSSTSDRHHVGLEKKRQHVPGHQSNVRLKQMKKSVIEMPRDDASWCAARAIVTSRGLSLAAQDTHARKQWIDPRRCVHCRQQATEALAREVRRIDARGHGA